MTPTQATWRRSGVGRRYLKRAVSAVESAWAWAMWPRTGKDGLQRVLQWTLAAAVLTQIVVTAGKWSTYPLDALREWFPHFGVLLFSRLVPYTVVIFGLWRVATCRWCRGHACTGFGVRVVFLAAGLGCLVSLAAELGLSILEWHVYPRYFTSGWYGGSLWLFEGYWILLWPCVFWVILAALLLVDRMEIRGGRPNADQEIGDQGSGVTY
jgi:hypothetical protein